MKKSAATSVAWILSSLFLAATFAILVRLPLPAAAAATTLYVSNSGDCGGMTPCYTSIQTAVDLAGDGDTIKIARGVYTGTTVQVVAISKALALRGGYDPGDWEIAAPDTNPTVIDAENVNGRRGVSVTGSGTGTVTLAGLTVRQGLITGAGAAGGGARVFANSGTVALNDNLIQGNMADYGGGLDLIGTAVTASRNVIENNMAVHYGGGVRLDSVGSAGTIFLNRNKIQGNSTRGSGGGIYTIYSGGTEYVLNGNEVLDNSAGWGGGISIQSGIVDAQNDVIANNRGGGVYVDGRLTARHWTLVSNEAYAIDAAGAPVAITNSIVASHTAGLSGGFFDHALFFNTPCTMACAGILTGNPEFINPNERDYHIGPVSAARDMGIDAGVVIDLDNEPRPLGLAPDLGADEVGLVHRLFLPVIKGSQGGLSLLIPGR